MKIKKWLKKAIQIYKKYSIKLDLEEVGLLVMHKHYGNKTLAIIIGYGDKEKVKESFKRYGN
ncbi:MAG: hypothetical protein ACFFAO_12430 [Candidatus Hermodarchaeota archaeon]